MNYIFSIGGGLVIRRSYKAFHGRQMRFSSYIIFLNFLSFNKITPRLDLAVWKNPIGGISWNFTNRRRMVNWVHFRYFQPPCALIRCSEKKLQLSIFKNDFFGVGKIQLFVFHFRVGTGNGYPSIWHRGLWRTLTSVRGGQKKIFWCFFDLENERSSKFWVDLTTHLQESSNFLLGSCACFDRSREQSLPQHCQFDKNTDFRVVEF